MSVKWNLYAERCRSQEVDDERMQQQKAKNSTISLTEVCFSVMILSVIWMINGEAVSTFYIAGAMLAIVGLLCLTDGVLAWYSGTALLRTIPLGEWPILYKLRQLFSVLLMDVVGPFAFTCVLLTGVERPKLAWVGAAAVTLAYYLLRVWCYDQYRKRTLDSGEYWQLTPEEKRENRQAQAAVICLTLVSLAPALLLPETALPGGARLERLAALEQAVSTYQEADAVAFEYRDSQTRAKRYHLPEEELTVYYGEADPPHPYLGAGYKVEEAWLIDQTGCYHYDGANWTQTSAQDVSQPVRSSMLQVSREQLRDITYSSWTWSYTVAFSQEALQAQLLQLDVTLMEAYHEVEAVYTVSEYSGDLVSYRYRAYGEKDHYAAADEYSLSQINMQPKQVAAQLARQKEMLGWPEGGSEYEMGSL